MSPFDQSTSRRRFLRFLAGSALFAYGAVTSYAGEGPTAATKLPDPIVWAPLDTQDLIASPKDAINVFDFEPVARKNVPLPTSAIWRRAPTMKSHYAPIARAF